MSFSGNIKDELVKAEGSARHCRIAELAALLVYSRSLKNSRIELPADSPLVAQKSRTLIEQLFNINMNEISADYCVYDSDASQKVFQTIKHTENAMTVNPLVIKSLCCKRCFLRGAFLSVGSMSNPEKGYHLEFVCDDEKQAEQIIETLSVFDIAGKLVLRKRYYVVYIKESEEIVELLNVIGAHMSLMNLENLRILKDMRNSINRRVNCEAANITKTVNAASKQIEDIQYIKERYGFDRLSDNLREAAQARLEYPDATLKELGELLTPAVGKSGVNHRLRKLSELAEKLRG